MGGGQGVESDTGWLVGACDGETIREDQSRLRQPGHSHCDFVNKILLSIRIFNLISIFDFTFTI